MSTDVPAVISCTCGCVTTVRTGACGDAPRGHWLGLDLCRRVVYGVDTNERPFSAVPPPLRRVLGLCIVCGASFLSASACCQPAHRALSLSWPLALRLWRKSTKSRATSSCSELPQSHTRGTKKKCGGLKPTEQPQPQCLENGAGVAGLLTFQTVAASACRSGRSDRHHGSGRDVSSRGGGARRATLLRATTPVVLGYAEVPPSRAHCPNGMYRSCEDGTGRTMRGFPHRWAPSRLVRTTSDASQGCHPSIGGSPNWAVQHTQGGLTGRLHSWCLSARLRGLRDATVEPRRRQGRRRRWRHQHLPSIIRSRPTTRGTLGGCPVLPRAVDRWR